MSWILRCLLLSMSMLLTAGCALYTDAPLGEPATFEPSEWEGLWVSHDGKVERFKSAVQGIKGIAVTENWRECDASNAGPWEEVFRGYTNKVHHEDDWYLLDYCKEGRLVTGEPCATSRVLLRQKESILLFGADDARIRKLLDEGKVPGRIEFRPEKDGQEVRVVLHSLTDAHYKVLFDPENGAFVPFRLEGAFQVSIRLPAELDPCNKPK